MEKTTNKGFYRRAIKVGNSAGVLLPKSFLGAEVRVQVLNNPQNTKKDIMKLLENYLEEVRGIYILSIENKKVEVLAVSMSLSKIIEKGNYKISIVPLQIIQKSLKEKKPISDKILKAKPIMNKWLLLDMRKSFSGS
ncbi:MAG: hypothetical protein WC781_00220 [Candidatus Pacearchaeota archaeon]